AHSAKPAICATDERGLATANAL
ncbi:hypothetical protein MGSAQ_003226, partial [marine sediment metagenome]